MAELEASIQQKLDSDTDFQSSIAELSDEDKTAKIDERKQQEFDKEISALSENAEKAAKNEELAHNYKTRAEKAEAEAKAQKEKPTPKNEQKYSLEEIDDIAALTSVPKEDRHEVLEHAKFKGITPAEALKSTYIKTFLKEQEELRKSANAANTGGGKRGTSKPSGEKILEDFQSGKIPESEEGIKDLVDAQWEKKKKK